MMVMVMPAPEKAVVMVMMMVPAPEEPVMMVVPLRKLDASLGPFRHRARVVGFQRGDRVGNRLEQVGEGIGGQ